MQNLSFQDRFEIFEQLNMHQRVIDRPWGIDAANAYLDLYWPEGSFTVNDSRHTVYTGPSEIKKMFDFGHSVIPLDRMFHSMGPFEIRGDGVNATANWRWFANWKEGDKGPLSTGTYTDQFEKRSGVWKCLHRISDVDPNFPQVVFAGWVAQGPEKFRES